MSKTRTEKKTAPRPKLRARKSSQAGTGKDKGHQKKQADNRQSRSQGDTREKTRRNPRKKTSSPPATPARDARGRILPGYSGNPAGRPKNKQSIPDLLRRISEEPGSSDGKTTKLELIMRRVFADAIKGNYRAIEYLSDRMEGRAVERSAVLTARKSIDEMTVDELEELLTNPETGVIEADWEETEEPT